MVSIQENLLHKEEILGDVSVRNLVYKHEDLNSESTERKSHGFVGLYAQHCANRERQIFIEYCLPRQV